MGCRGMDKIIANDHLQSIFVGLSLAIDRSEYDYIQLPGMAKDEHFLME